jgi:hypothetical protein
MDSSSGIREFIRVPLPVAEDSKPSFFVRLVRGHWVFKDFSSGAGGTVFDFVQMKENLGPFSVAVVCSQAAGRFLGVPGETER